MRRGERVVAREVEGSTWFCGELKGTTVGFYFVRPYGNNYLDDRMCQDVLPLNEETWNLIGTTQSCSWHNGIDATPC